MARSESARACPWSAARTSRSTWIVGGRFVFIVTADESTGERYQLDRIRTPAFQAPLRRNSRLTLARLTPNINATNTAAMVDRWITTVVSVLVSIRPRPAPCTGGHPDRVSHRPRTVPDPGERRSALLESALASSVPPTTARSPCALLLIHGFRTRPAAARTVSLPDLAAEFG
jgi:hypothetical protein